MYRMYCNFALVSANGHFNWFLDLVLNAAHRDFMGTLEYILNNVAHFHVHVKTHFSIDQSLKSFLKLVLLTAIFEYNLLDKLCKENKKNK